MIITTPDGAPAIGRAPVNLGLPASVLVVLLHRGGHIVVPQGSTDLLAGDRLLLLADERGRTGTRGGCWSVSRRKRRSAGRRNGQA